jgi:uncharacterized protein YkwD
MKRQAIFAFMLLAAIVFTGCSLRVHSDVDEPERYTPKPSMSDVMSVNSPEKQDEAEFSLPPESSSSDASDASIEQQASGPPSAAASLTSLEIDVPETLNRYSSLKLTAKHFPEDSSAGTLTFRSDDDSVLICSPDGEIYAKKSGAATITCESSYGVSVSRRITVVVPVAHVTVLIDGAYFKPGDNAAFTVDIYPEDADVTNISVTTSGCEAEGNTLNFFAAGTAVITATTDNGTVGSAKATVIDPTEFEDEVVMLVNNERRSAGLAALENSEIIRNAARVRAIEIGDVFDHTRPDGSICFTALDEGGIPYMSAAENIAFGQKTPSEVVEGWMNSPGHRANILGDFLGKIGVGFDIVDGNFCWVQLFTD